MLKEDWLGRLHAIASAHGGRCLSEHYLGARAQHMFRCAVGHEWTARACNVVEGHWCRQCVFDRQRNVPLAASRRGRIGSALTARDGLKQLQAAAQARGGVCLSTAYSNARGRYEFACSAGHRWQADGAKIIAGSWCRLCAYEAQRLTLADAQAMAIERGGQCLSERYLGVSSKLSWLCSEGHGWSTTFSTVRAGHWCPLCARAARIGSKNANAHLKYKAAGKTE
jgi:hypothetical protein